MDVTRTDLSKFTTDESKELLRILRAIPLTVNADGTVAFSPALPTSEPATIGALWTNSGVLTISNGP